MKKILVIDDEAPVRKMLNALLTSNGYDVIEAENGKKGLALFDEHSPDLLITDIVMPESDGLEIITTLKRNKSDMAIIAISSGGKMANTKMYLTLASKLGVDKIFEKPVDNELLISAIKSLI